MQKISAETEPAALVICQALQIRLNGKSAGMLPEMANACALVKLICRMIRELRILQGFAFGQLWQVASIRYIHRLCIRYAGVSSDGEQAADTLRFFLFVTVGIARPALLWLRKKAIVLS